MKVIYCWVKIAFKLALITALVLTCSWLVLIQCERTAVARELTSLRNEASASLSRVNAFKLQYPCGIPAEVEVEYSLAMLEARELNDRANVVSLRYKQ